MLCGGSGRGHAWRVRPFLSLFWWGRYFVTDYPIGAEIKEFGCGYGIHPAHVTGRSGDLVHVMVHVQALDGIRVVDIPHTFSAAQGPDIRPPEARRDSSRAASQAERHRRTLAYFAGRSPDDEVFSKVEGDEALVRARAPVPADYDNKACLPWSSVRGGRWPIRTSETSEGV